MNERGFTLVEAVTTIVILGIVAVGVLPAFFVMMAANTRNEVRSGAVTATQWMLEDLRVADPTTLSTSGSDFPVSYSVGNRDYDVITHYCIRPEYCDEFSRHLFIEVTIDGRKVYDTETVYTQLR